MTDLQLFAFVVLPVLLVVGAGITLLIERRRWRTVDAAEPDFFDSPRPRSIANSDGLSKPSKRSR